MRIMVITRNAWDEANSIGNTLTNFFADWSGSEFYNLYFRNALPHNPICRNYFRITEMSILRHLFSHENIGVAFQIGETDQQRIISKKENGEMKLIQIFHKLNIQWAYHVSEALWNSKKWINKKFNLFIEDASPDIVFAFAKGEPQYALSIEYLLKHTNAKLVLFIADDVYSDYERKNTKSAKKAMSRFVQIIKMADKVYGISDEICEMYSRRFQTEITALRKGCNLLNSPKEKVNEPLKIVYAGNLLFGRFTTLCEVVCAVNKINSNGIKVELEIYSRTPINRSQVKLLEYGHSSFLGFREYDEIKVILSAADIVLHVESFDEREASKVRYSFSTKIIDCLQSASVLIVIGPKGITSVEYPKLIPGVVVIDDFASIEPILYKELNNKENLIRKAKLIHEFTKEHHDIAMSHKIVYDDFLALLEMQI